MSDRKSPGLRRGRYELERPDPGQVPEKFLRLIAGVVAEHATYFVADVAQRDSGEWILIELNDGTQSGISENDPDVLYSNLKNALGQ